VTSRSTVESLAKNSKYFSPEKKRTRRVSQPRQIKFAVSSETGVNDSGGSGAACKAESIIESGEITKYSVWGKGNAKDSIQDCFMLLFTLVCSDFRICNFPP
jgi:hypothetical protein